MRIAAAGAVVAAFGVAGWYAATHKDQLTAMFGGSKTADGAVPLVRADPKVRIKPTETAALEKPDSAGAKPETQPAVQPIAVPDDGAKEAAALDQRYQSRPLWSYMKRTFPEWYRDTIAQSGRMIADKKPPLDATRHMVESLVALRRKHAEQALSAGAPRLVAIASAFLDNLQSLSDRGATTCYSFISQGEASPPIVEILHADTGNAPIEQQAIAIFEAMADGKASPVQHDKPKKEDYDLLASQLNKLGWGQADLQMFADPNALSRAEPAKVCQMVRDWFKAHITISDQTVQERLLFETLRPVVAG